MNSTHGQERTFHGTLKAELHPSQQHRSAQEDAWQETITRDLERIAARRLKYRPAATNSPGPSR